MRLPVAFAVLLMLAADTAWAGKPAKRKRAAQAAAASRSNAAVASVAALEPAQVLYVTTDRAFINRGARDGLAAGTSVPLMRGGRKVGVCSFDNVGDHSASCPIKVAKRGDRLSIERRAATPALPRAPLPNEAELARRLQAVETAQIPLVDFADGSQTAAPKGTLGRVALSHTTFSNVGAGFGPFQIQQLDATLFELPLGRGLSVAADVSVIYNGRRPEGFRAPQKGTALLWVRELSIAWQPATLPFVARAGRIRLRSTLGLQMLDGVQVGWRGSGGLFEAGLYAGLLPEALALTPSTAWAAGTYGLGTWTFGEGAKGLWLQSRARAGWTVRPSLGSRLEANLGWGMWWATRFSTLAQVDLSGASSVSPAEPVSVDSASLDVGARLGENFRLNLFGRYRGARLSETLPIGATFPLTRSIHAGASTSVDVSTWLALRIYGGSANELGTTLGQYFAGLEVSAPRLARGRLWAALGYQEEPGWVWGRSAYAQAHWRPGKAFSLMVRAAWFQRLLGTGLENDIGSTAAFEVRPARWLFVKASGMARAPILASAEDDGAGPRRPVSVVGTLTLGGEI